jgi:hypothetical protein
MPKPKGPKPKERFTVEGKGEGVIVWKSREGKVVGVMVKGFSGVHDRHGEKHYDTVYLVRLD